MMKKFAAVVLFSSLAFTSGAFAGATTAAVNAQLLADGYTAVGDLTTNINIARPFNILPVAARAGFVKNRFEVTLSANVVAGVFDNATNSRMGVISGSTKGYNTFTGSSVGGSVTQCGAPVLKTQANLAGSQVIGTNMDLDKDNGCNRAF